MDHKQAWHDLLDWFHNGTEISYKKGQILIRPEDKPRDLFVLMSGTVKVFSITRSGDENIRVFKKPDEVFPLVWVLKPVRRETYYAAANDVVVRRRSRKQLIEYIDKHPLSAKALLEQVSNMFILYSDRINNLEFRYARERIAYRLVSLADTFGNKTKRGIEIQLPIKQLELADTINVTRETASRELLRLKGRKIIDYKDNAYTVLDIEKLRAEY